jgi:putative hydrolases of HD superfamily
MEEVIRFIFELDKLKGVTRKTKPLGLDRYENSAEHSWQIAMFASVLVPQFAPELDVSHIVAMLLVHDVGEIDTGDTIVFAVGGWEERKAAELAAVRRIFGLLPEPHASRFVGLWEEFELGRSPEARFAKAIDRAMPALLNLSNNGQSWRENGISYQRVVDRVGPEIEAGCPALWAYMAPRLKAAHDAGWFNIVIG